MKLDWLRAAALLAACLVAGAAHAAIPIWDAVPVRAFPHDPKAFTEGLFYEGGFLYESTGLAGLSDIRKVELATGRVLRSRRLAPTYFGEGIVDWKGRLIELTWRNEVGFVYDLATFKPRGRFTYVGEGWALTKNARELIMSDGTPRLRFLSPATLKVTHTLDVTADGAPVQNLNELEWVKGEILANIWLTPRIARIDPASGRVTGWIDLSAQIRQSGAPNDSDAVPNGIAYDAAHDRLYVTGKLWPKLFEIRLVRRP
jgi:glutaminyl-peptide cyclotransferase